MNNDVGWKVYIGLAVEDKVYDSRLLKVHITELTPYITGELQDLTGKETCKIIDEDKDETEDIEVISTNVFTCEYFGFTTNRVFPPDIRKGEQVLVLKYGDADKYYWHSLGRDDRLRKKEILRYAVSNSDETDKDLNESNTYFFELDTLHKKRIRLQTSNSDGEKFIYSVVIDAKNNFVSILDNIGNEIILESELPRIKMKNSDGSIVDIKKKDIFVMAKEDISFVAGKTLSFKSANEIHLTKEVLEVQVPKMTVKAPGGMSLITPSLDLSGALRAALSVETTNMIATLYNIGIVPPPFPPGTVNYEKGIGEGTEPNIPAANSGTGLRNTAAQLEVSQALVIIQACLTVINSHITLPAEHNTLTALGISALMPFNKGV